MSKSHEPGDDRYDVAVVGAGPAGAATARGLARAGRRVVLLERSRFDQPRIGESLAPAVQPLLRALELWDAFTALGPMPSWGTRSVWGAEAENVHSHLMSPYACGWHVDRLAFDRMLAEGAAAAGADLRLGTAVQGCERAGDLWRLYLAGPEGPGSLQAAVVVDATGRTASLARRLKARRRLLDRLVAVAAPFEGIAGGDQGYTLVEAAEAGWWYSAPVPGDGLVAMLMTDADLLASDRAAAVASWRVGLDRAAATQARTRGAAPRELPRVVSAVSQRLRRAHAPGPWLAVGDAALAVDPVSGSGVVRALRTAAAAVRTTLALLEGAGPQALAAYEIDRDREWSIYRRERALYYGLEQRWPGHPFWRRRHVPHLGRERAGPGKLSRAGPFLL